MNLPQLAALAFLSLIVIVPLAILAVSLSRSRMNPLQCLLWGIAYLLCKFLWRTRWSGPLPLGETEGGIIACNHRSSIDPFFIQTITNRKVHWMVAREFCEHWAFRGFLKACEVIPVGRGGVDTAATKAAIRITSSGGLIGMLPEGRINMTEQLLLPARPGVALVALKARVPVVPCYIAGAPYRRHAWSPFFMPARVEVRIGRPINLAEFYGREQEPGVMQEALRRILKAVAELGGEPDFEPQFAGKKWKPTPDDLNAAMDAADERAGF